MFNTDRQTARTEAHRGSGLRWSRFTEIVDEDFHRKAADVKHHQRFVMGSEGSDDAYVSCCHSMHNAGGHWVERQPWPCPELLEAAEYLGIDLVDTIEAQRRLDEAAYGQQLEPAERMRLWNETHPRL